MADPSEARPNAAPALTTTSRPAGAALHSSRADWLLFAMLGAIWGSSFLFIKIGLDYIGPFELVSFRLLFGTMALAAIVRVAREPLPRDRATIGKLLFLAVFNVAIPFSLITWGELSIPSGTAAILNATVPLFTVCIAALAIGETFDSPRAAGLAAGFAGVVIVVSRNAGGGSIAGELAVAAAACSYAVSNVFARRHLGHLRPMIIAIGQVGLALPIVAVAAVVLEHPWTVPLRPEPILATLWLGALGAAVAYLISFRLLQRWDATRASLVTYLLPIVGVTLGAVVLGEQVDARVVLGTILIVGGVAMVNLRGLRRPGLSAAVPAEEA
jgi:drug/metabolite transporter (DMT)-like permease